jgi:hypothetical protein
LIDHQQIETIIENRNVFDKSENFWCVQTRKKKIEMKKFDFKKLFGESSLLTLWLEKIPKKAFEWQ